MNDVSPPIALDQAIAAYLAHQRALGRDYNNEERVLNSVHRFIARVAADDLTPVVFHRWCQELQHLAANTRRARQLIVRKFCLYRRRSEPGCFVPDSLYFARPQPHRSAIIVQPDQVARMLAAANELGPTPGSPLLPAVMRIALVLLYTTGLRRGELLRLTLGDVESRSGVLRIRESKFHKSRWVPLSPDGRCELRRYLRKRLATGLDPRPSAPLLCNCTRGLRGYTGTGISRGIHELFRVADVRDNDGHLPRVHDLRHSFAVQALVRWYREGTDVQSQLPKLALYMGHVSIVSTAHYLQFVPQVSTLASARFEHQFGDLLQEACL